MELAQQLCSKNTTSENESWCLHSQPTHLPLDKETQPASDRYQFQFLPKTLYYNHNPYFQGKVFSPNVKQNTVEEIINRELVQQGTIRN